MMYAKLKNLNKMKWESKTDNDLSLIMNNEKLLITLLILS